MKEAQIEAARSRLSRLLKGIARHTRDTALSRMLSMLPAQIDRGTCRYAYVKAIELMPRINAASYDKTLEPIIRAPVTKLGIDLTSRVLAQWHLLKYALSWKVFEYLSICEKSTELKNAVRGEITSIDAMLSELKEFPRRRDGLSVEHEVLAFVELAKSLKKVSTTACIMGATADFRDARGDPDGQVTASIEQRGEQLAKLVDDLRVAAMMANEFAVLQDNAGRWTSKKFEAERIRKSSLPLASLYLMLGQIILFFDDAVAYENVKIWAHTIDLVAERQILIFASLPYAKEKTHASAVWKDRQKSIVKAITNRMAGDRVLVFSQKADLIDPIAARGGSSAGLCSGLTYLYGAAVATSSKNGGRRLIERIRKIVASPPREGDMPLTVGDLVKSPMTAEEWHSYTDSIATAHAAQFDAQMVRLFELEKGRVYSSAAVTPKLLDGVGYYLASCCVSGPISPKELVGYEGYAFSRHAVYVRREGQRFHFFDPNLGIYENQSEKELIRQMNRSLGVSCEARITSACGWYKALELSTFDSPNVSWRSLCAKAKSIVAEECAANLIWYEQGTRVDVRYIATAALNPRIAAVVIVNGDFTWTAHEVSLGDHPEAVGKSAYAAWRQMLDVRRSNLHARSPTAEDPTARFQGLPLSGDSEDYRRQAFDGNPDFYDDRLESDRLMAATVESLEPLSGSWEFIWATNAGPVVAEAAGPETELWCDFPLCDS